MSDHAAVDLLGVSHAYRQRLALRDVTLRIPPGELFVFLGPNGGGKTTLFRILATLIPCQTGTASILGCDLRREAARIREKIGVVFQAPSLDKKLTVIENMRCQAAMYGISGALRSTREAELLKQFGLQDRAHDRTETLSGGLRRRVELAKGLLHHPRLLLLDEPSTGLDPGARSDLWQYLSKLRTELGTTIVLTTHLLEEAERADRIAILDQGALVALDPPDRLRATVGGDTITIRAERPLELARDITERFGSHTQCIDDHVRLEVPDGHLWVPRLFDAFPGRLQAVTIGRPTLDDVFMAKTGHRFWTERTS